MSYTDLATPETLQKTVQALTAKGYVVQVLSSGAQALAAIQALIPPGASVMNGSSTTLKQIGYLDYLAANEHPWNDLHAKIAAENDETKRQELRRQSVLSDYYLGSVHALTESGDMLIASNTGSQLPHVVSTSPHLIFVVSTKKIVTDVPAAIRRIEEHVVPLEDERMQATMNARTALNKLLIFKGEAAFMGRTIHVLLVEEDLGF